MVAEFYYGLELIEEVLGLGVVFCLILVVNGGVDFVHSGGHECAYAALESVEHVHDGPASGDVEFSLGRLDDLGVFWACGGDFDFEPLEFWDCVEEVENEFEGESGADGVPVL